MAKGRLILLGIMIVSMSLIGFGCDGSGTGTGCGETAPEPRILGGGIGVSNLERSIEFYTTVLELEVVGRQPGKLSRIVEEVRLKDRDDQDIYLMDFEGDANYTNNPAELVFAVSDAKRYHDAVVSAGGRSLSEPTRFLGSTVALIYDPEGYIVELIEADTAVRPVLVAVASGQAI